MKECYCQSGALSQFSMISKAMLQTRYDSIFAAVEGAPVVTSVKTKKGITPDLLASSLSRRPVLLVGDVGVGKTSFIRHLIKVDANDILGKSLVIYIDLGSKHTMSASIGEATISTIADQLIASGIKVWDNNFIRGAYRSELDGFEKGIYGSLKTSDPPQYAKEELKFLADLIGHKDKHIRCCIEHVVKSHKRQVVIFIDNSDQRGPKDQRDAFLAAQEIAQHWPAMVFLSIRPETFHETLKDTISGYHPKAFTISPPRIDDVIRQRLNFALKVTGGQIPLAGFNANIKLARLGGFINAFLDSFDSMEELPECLDNISGGNVRVALDYIRKFFGSGHINTKKICEIIDKQDGFYVVRIFEFLKAVIYGDNSHYSPINSPVANLFDVSSSDPKEHFLLPCLLGVLSGLASAAKEAGFVETATLYEAMQEIGFTPSQIESAIQRAMDKDLLEAQGRRAPIIDEYAPLAYRITSIGKYHLLKLPRMFTYVDAIVIDTPVIEKSYSDNITMADSIQKRVERVEYFVAYLTHQWQKCSHAASRFDWPATVADLNKDIVEVKQRSGLAAARGT
jgi:hypothetical protein